MNRAACIALVVCAALAPLQARATRLTRVIVHNKTDLCMRVGVQRQGPHASQWFGPLARGVSFDRVFAVDGNEAPKYFVEVALDECATGKARYRDFHITNSESIVVLQVVPRGGSFALKPWP